jgi:hypothetical protein
MSSYLFIYARPPIAPAAHISFRKIFAPEMSSEELKRLMIHRILKTATHPFYKFIFEYLLVLPLPAAKNAKSLFKNSNNSGDGVYYCADDGQLYHLSKPENLNATANETDVPPGNGEPSSASTIPKNRIPFF